MTPQHPTTTRTTPKQHYVVNDEAFLNNPFELGSMQYKFFEGLKFVFEKQGHISRNNYDFIGNGEAFKYSKSACGQIQRSHIKKGYIEVKYV